MLRSAAASNRVPQTPLSQVEEMADMYVLEGLTVTALDQLTNLYARPSDRVLRKEIDHVDALGRAFIAASPFLVLATASSQGLDCSSKPNEAGRKIGQSGPLMNLIGGK